MKLCIPATAADLDAPIDERLGRAACFVLADSEAGVLVEARSNTQNRQAAEGAGVQAGRQIAELQPDAVLCAHCGPKAFRVLQAAGIAVYVGASGTVRDAVAAHRDGRLSETTDANVEGHW